MLEIFHGVSIHSLAIKMLATTIVVIMVTIAVPRVGAAIGGALSGVPMVIGPGFFFMLNTHTPEFIADAAIYGLLAMCINQLFLLTYIVIAYRASALQSITGAIVIWFSIAYVLQPVSLNLLFVTTLFFISVCVAYFSARRFCTLGNNIEGEENYYLLFLRAIMAGILVAVVTVSAHHIGAEWSGLLIAFPIGYTVLSITIHQQYGSASVISVLHAAMLGAIGLMSFCFALAITVHHFTPLYAFYIALATSFLSTLLLVFGRRYIARF
ncbi:MAG: hypothetical protein ACRBBR_03725 [Cellvibrionaceae bacterium]